MEKVMPYALEDLKELADLLQRLTPEQKRQIEKTIEDVRLDDDIRRILDAMDYKEAVATYRIMMQFVMLPPARQENILRISDELLKQQAKEKPTDGSDRQA